MTREDSVTQITRAPKALAGLPHLMAVEPAYGDRLSEVSARTLRGQGGPMTREEVAAFERRPEWRDALRLRRWDDAAKDPAAVVAGIEGYVADIRATVGLHRARDAGTRPALRRRAPGRT